MAFLDHGGVMKKSLIVMLLGASLTACGTQPAAPDYGNSLISFADIAAEITVAHQEADPSEVQDGVITLGFAE